MTPTTWMVENANSSGTGSLAAAVSNAQFDTASPTIMFDPAVFTQATTILSTDLSISNLHGQLPVTVDGSGAGPITISGGGTNEIFQSTGTNTFRNLTFTNGSIGSTNFREGGGAIYCSGTTTIVNCIFNGNSAGAGKYGGAIYNAGTLTVFNSTFSNNTSTGSVGGAIENDFTYGPSAVTATILNCSFFNNSAYFGAAIDNTRSAMTIENSTISGNTGNTGGSLGGAIRNFGNSTPATLSVLSCTITNNSAGSSGGGIYNSGFMNLENSIVAGNTATANPDVYENTSGGATFTASHDLIGNTTGSGITAGNGNILAPTFVGLGTLGNNGGPTLTTPLVAGSPALGAAGAATTISAAVSNATTTTITVANLSRFAASALPTLSSGSYFTIQIGGERMAVIGASSSTLIVVRGVNGTTASAHANAAPVYLVSDQRGALAPFANPVVLNMGASQQIGVLPAVTSVSPNRGTINGGTSIVITGSGFTGATAVSFGTTAAASFTVNSDAQITAISPGDTGVADVTVVTAGGTSPTSSADQFTYATDPIITGVSPATGPAPGGTSVIIMGSGFANATAVNFGSTNATSFVVNSATQITAVSPAGAGAVDITVVTSAGTTFTWSFDNFTYIAAPIVLAVSPNFAILAGGNSATITGTTFTAATAVSFGGIPATSFTVNSPTQITAIAPPEVAGTVDITVSNTSGTSPISANDQFTYDGASVVVTTVSDAVVHTGISLRDAIATADRDAGNGQSDTITFDPSLNGQTITLSQGLLLLQPPSGTPSGVITIVGNNQITVDGNNASSIFELANDAVLSGLTIQHSSGSAVIGFGFNTMSTLINCTLKNNSYPNANSDGGSAIYSYYGNMAVINCTISGNTTTGPGAFGAIFTITNMTFVNTTITGNSPQAIEQYVNNITLLNSTITANPFGAISGVESPPPLLAVTDSILVNNGSQDVGIPNDAITNYDMIGTGAGSTGTGNITNPSNVGLGTLGNNGGPVQTIPLLTGSPALAAGGAVEPLYAPISSTTSSSFTVANGTLFAAASMLPLASGYYTIQIDHEQMNVTSVTLGNYNAVSGLILSGGSGYAVGNLLTVSSGTGTPTTLTVTSVNAGVITGFAIASPGSYTADYTIPGSPTFVTGGSGTGAVFILNYYPVGTFTVVRGADGTTPATHAAGTPIYLVSDARGAVLPSTDTPIVNMGAVNSADVSSQLQPIVTALSPDFGFPGGGASVIITGMNFTGTTAVNFGGAAATSFTVNSATQITATSPAGAGVVDVAITTPAGGTSPASRADLFTYIAATTTTLTDNGPSPSAIGQAVSFIATVGGGPDINGETVFIEDANLGNAVVASPTLTAGTVIFSIADLGGGMHHLFAVYDGDATHTASNDSATPVNQVVTGLLPAVLSVIVNGGAPAYLDSNGLAVSLAGQNSIVEQFQVIFNESVTLDPGAFTITNNADGVTVNSGPNPNTLAVNAGFAVVADTNNTQYLVTFSGPGTTAIPGGTGNVIKDGLYILNTIGSHVHANGLTAVADTNTGFWALYGSAPNGNALTSEPGAYLGDGNSEVFVSNFDYSEFKTAFGSESDFPIGPPAPYDVSMDFDLNGFVDNFDYAAFKNNFGADWVF